MQTTLMYQLVSPEFSKVSEASGRFKMTYTRSKHLLCPGKHYSFWRLCWSGSTYSTRNKRFLWCSVVHGRLQKPVGSSWRGFPATLSHDLSPHLPHLYLSSTFALLVLFLFYQQTLNRCIRILRRGKDQDPNSFLQTKPNSRWLPPFNSRPKLTVQCQPILIYFCSVKWNLNH